MMSSPSSSTNKSKHPQTKMSFNQFMHPRNQFKTKPDYKQLAERQIPDYSIPSTKINLDATFQIISVQDIAQSSPNDYCESLYTRKEDEEKRKQEEERKRLKERKA